MKCWSIMVLALALFVAADAGAQATANTEEALRLAYQADELFQTGRWGDAYEGFARAEAIAHSPAFVLYMGHCRRNEGRLLEAEALYRRVSAEKLPPDAPKPFVDAAADATRELDSLGARIPSLRVAVHSAPGDAALTVDGKSEQLGAVIRVDPGSHLVAATSAGQEVSQRVALEEGADTVAVTLTFGGEGTAPAEASEGSFVPAIIAVAIGGAALVAGGITGGIAASLASDIKEGCIDDHCLAEDAGDLDTAQTLALVSTIGFIAGAVGVAAGTVLVIVRPGGGDAESAMLEVRVSF